MSDAWSEAGAFGELRSMLNDSSSGKAFDRIIKLLEHAESHEPGIYAARWRGYVEGALRDWPPEVCATTVWGREAAVEVAAVPWRGLFKGLTLRGFDLGRGLDAEWIAGDLRARFQDLVHLGFMGMYVLKAQIERACRVGVFDGVRSLSFQDCAFRPVTLDVLMSHIESSGGVERLAFRQCSFGVAQIERLCSSPMARTLEALDLSWNQGIKRAGFEVLAQSVAGFSRMRELSLGGTSMSVASARALAGATWAPAMEQLELRGAAISTAGFEAFIDEGKLDLLIKKGSHRRLDLWGFSLRDRALASLASCEDLATVDDLWLHGNELGSVACLLGSPHLGRLESLDVSGNAMTQATSEGLNAVIEMTSPRALSVEDMPLGDGFVERLCASGESNELDAFAMKGGGYRERALVALLEWPRLDALRVFHSECHVAAGSSLAARAVASGRFTEGQYGPAGDLVTLGSYRGYVFEGRA